MKQFKEEYGCLLCQIDISVTSWEVALPDCLIDMHCTAIASVDFDEACLAICLGTSTVRLVKLVNEFCHRISSQVREGKG